MKEYKWIKEDKWFNICDKCCSKCMDRHTHLCKKSCFYLCILCDSCKHHIKYGSKEIVMECEKCSSKELEGKIIDTNYEYNTYFKEDIKIDAVKIKCKKCGHEWVEVV